MCVPVNNICGNNRQAWQKCSKPFRCLRRRPGPGPLGCRLDASFIVEMICAGRQSCVLAVQIIQIYLRRNPCQKGLPNYAEISYSCNPSVVAPKNWREKSPSKLIAGAFSPRTAIFKRKKKQKTRCCAQPNIGRWSVPRARMSVPKAYSFPRGHAVASNSQQLFSKVFNVPDCNISNSQNVIFLFQEVLKGVCYIPAWTLYCTSHTKMYPRSMMWTPPSWTSC